MHGRERRLVRLWRYTKFKPTLNSRPWSPYVISHPQARPTNQIWVHNGLNPQQFPPGQNFIHEYHPFRDASSTPALAARFLVLSSGWDLDEVWMNFWCKRDEAWGLCSSRFLEEDDEWMNIIQVWPFFSIWIGLVYCLECVVGPFLSSGRAERPTIFDLLRQSCGRGYDSCWWGWGVGGVFPQNNWIEIFLGFAFCWSRLGEVLCNLLRGKGREFERILKLVGEFLPSGYFFRSWESWKILFDFSCQCNFLWGAKMLRSARSGGVEDGQFNGIARRCAQLTCMAAAYGDRHVCECPPQRCTGRKIWEFVLQSAHRSGVNLFIKWVYILFRRVFVFVLVSCEIIAI